MYNVSYASRHKYPAATVGIEVPVELTYEQESFKFMAKIDTGAAFCIFQRQCADALGIDVESGMRQILSTPNGPFETFKHEVELECLGYKENVFVCFAALPSFSRNVLGRAGWLDRHRLGFVDHDSVIYLSHYNNAT